MRRLACSITVRMYIRAPVSVTVSMKSAVSSASAWERRKSVQVVAARSGAGVDPGLAQDLPDGGRGDVDPEREQFAVHPAIPPAAVLLCQAQHQHSDGAQGAGPAASLWPRCRGVAVGDQVTVPVENRVGPEQ